jgi:hypothetical protein
LIGNSACQGQRSAARASLALTSDPTVDQVCGIIAKQMTVERSFRLDVAKGVE